MRNLLPFIMKRYLLFTLLIGVSLLTRGQDYNQVISDIRLDSLVMTVRAITGEDSVYVNGIKTLIKTRSNTLSATDNNKAADYIKERLLKYNLTIEDQRYSFQGRNIIAAQVGKEHPDSLFIICAHYDAVANYCADDNASGVAAVIEAARVLSKKCFEYTILYALWDEEELGLIGSGYYAQNAYSEGYKISGVLNLEMFGYDSNDDGKFEIHTNNLPGSLAIKDALLNTVNGFSLSLVPDVVNPGTPYSDHSSFWNKNYGAVIVCQYFFGGDGTPYYHTDNDRIGLFNLEYFMELSKLSIVTAATMAKMRASCETEVKTLSCSPENRDVYFGASNTSFTITSNTTWTVSDNADWLAVSPSDGNNNGTITAEYNANSSTESRTATITITGDGTGSQSVTVTQIGAPNGIGDQERNHIRIYPNPTEAIINVEGMSGELHVSVFDLNGRLIIDKQMTEKQIDLNSLMPGVYLIKLETDTESIIRQFIKK